MNNLLQTLKIISYFSSGHGEDADPVHADPDHADRDGREQIDDHHPAGSRHGRDPQPCRRQWARVRGGGRAATRMDGEVKAAASWEWNQTKPQERVAGKRNRNPGATGEHAAPQEGLWEVQTCAFWQVRQETIIIQYNTVVAKEENIIIILLFYFQRINIHLFLLEKMRKISVYNCYPVCAICRWY